VAFAPGDSLNPPHPTIPNEIELNETISLVDTWKAMIALPKSKVRAIGVSNFGIDAMEGITKATGVTPVSQIYSIYIYPFSRETRLSIKLKLILFFRNPSLSTIVMKTTSILQLIALLATTVRLSAFSFLLFHDTLTQCVASPN